MCHALLFARGMVRVVSIAYTARTVLMKVCQAFLDIAICKSSYLKIR